MNVYKYKRKMPSAKEWKTLRSFANWSLYEDSIFEIAAQNTLYAITVYKNHEVIGMGRVVGDGIICFYIQDVVINPLYRNKGIGKNIVLKLLNIIQKNARPNAVIGLMSAKGTEKFYEKLGFVQRPNNTMGSGMVLLNDKV